MSASGLSTARVAPDVEAAAEGVDVVDRADERAGGGGADHEREDDEREHRERHARAEEARSGYAIDILSTGASARIRPSVAVSAPSRTSAL